MVPEIADKKERSVPDLQLPDELQHELSLAHLGELWIIAVRANIDNVGSGKTIDRLGPYMRHSGMSIGIRLVDQYKIGNDPESLLDVFQMIQGMHHIKGVVIKTSDSLMCEIGDCPFSDAPMELCHQHSAFFNGILDVVSPENEFVYDKMMSLGDEKCHWKVMKKVGKTRDDIEQAASDDPGKRLTTRFVDGEISEEEFDKRMAALKRHGLVK